MATLPKVTQGNLGTALTNARHERFAQLVVSGVPASRAHAEVGFKGSDKAHEANSSRLIRDDKVAARIAELRAPALAIAQEQAEEAIGSAAWIIAKAGEVVNRALNAVPVTRMERGELVTVDGEWTCNLSAATPALTLLAKLHPEFRETASSNPLTADDLRSALSEGRERLKLVQ